VARIKGRANDFFSKNQEALAASPQTDICPSDINRVAIIKGRANDFFFGQSKTPATQCFCVIDFFS